MVTNVKRYKGMDRCMDAWTNVSMGGWMGGWVDGWMDSGVFSALKTSEINFQKFSKPFEYLIHVSFFFFDVSRALVLPLRN